MNITRIDTRRIALPFASPMVTSYGRYDDRQFLFVGVESSDGDYVWAECSALQDTSYFWENIDAAERSINKLTDQLLAIDLESQSVASVVKAMDSEIGPMSATAIEMAILDLELRQKSLKLKDFFEVTADRVPASIALGIPVDRSISTLLDQVRDRYQQGFRTMKLKIDAQWHVDPVKEIRNLYAPEQLHLMVDANECFNRDDHKVLQELGEFDLILEQPLHRDDWEGHAGLISSGVKTICLDESVNTVDDVNRAASEQSAQMLCLKPSRLGGFVATKSVQKRCDELGISYRIGGMYSSAKAGAGERVATFGRPFSDIAAYGSRFRSGTDLVEAEEIGPDGTVAMPDEIGFGPSVSDAQIEEYLYKAR